MAYILGVIITDGCLVEHRNGYHGLDITSKDKDFLENIRHEFNKEVQKKGKFFRASPH